MSQFLRAFQSNSDWNEAYVSLIAVLVHFIYMFIANYVAQMVSDHFYNVFSAA